MYKGGYFLVNDGNAAQYGVSFAFSRRYVRISTRLLESRGCLVLLAFAPFRVAAFQGNDGNTSQYGGSLAFVPFKMGKE